MAKEKARLVVWFEIEDPEETCGKITRDIKSALATVGLVPLDGISFQDIDSWNDMIDRRSHE